MRARGRPVGFIPALGHGPRAFSRAGRSAARAAGFTLLEILVVLAIIAVATLLAMVGAGRWASIVPRAWIATYRAPSGTRTVELAGSDEHPLATPVALVRTAGEPESVLARALADSPNLRVALGATVTGLEIAGGRVAALRLHLEGAGAGRLALRELVLAAGGNESTRLLLAAQRDHGDLFGGRDGPLGRFYMGHVTGQVADIVLEDETLHAGLDYHVDAHGSYVRRRLVPAGEVPDYLDLVRPEPLKKLYARAVNLIK